MNVSFSTAVFGSAVIHFSSGDRPRPVAAATRQTSVSALKPLVGEVARLRTAIDELKAGVSLEPAGLSTKSTASVAVSASSSQPLGMTLNATAATLASTTEINTIGTSYTPFGPALSGASTSLPTLSGIYDGSQGDDVLTFAVKKEGNVGGPYTGKFGLPANLRVEVRRANNARITDIDFTEAIPAGTPFAIGNGLVITFAAGSLVGNDTFQLSVSQTTPSSVDPTKPVDGVRNDNPNFEPAFAVIPGSFDVNGVSIAVNSGDSINDVLTRITNSAAGVSAVFDVPTEAIILTQKTAGSGGQISFANDSSGFLAATKLLGASAVPGTDSDLDKPISQVAALSGVHNGAFSINGIQFNVDTAQDSLSDLLQAINASAAGVTAVYEEDKVVVTSADPEASLELNDGTSQFFSGTNLTAGILNPVKTSVVETDNRVSIRALAQRLTEQFEELNREFRGLFSRFRAAGLGQSHLREVLHQGIKDPLFNRLNLMEPVAQRDALLDTRLGFGFTLDRGSVAPFHVNESELEQALEDDPARVLDFLLADGADSAQQGLFASLITTLEGVEAGLKSTIGSAKGLLVDILV